MKINSEIEIKKVCVVGLGYIGLPTAALLANKGYQVVGVDILPSVVEIINSGKIHIIEPELAAFVASAINSGNLKAQLKPEEADIFIVSVPTPFKNEYQPDLKHVLDALNSIIPFIKPGNIIILESTSPIGTTEYIEKILIDNKIDVNSIYIAYCPERVLPGKIIEELISNDRIIGGINIKSSDIVASFYKTFIVGKVLKCDAKTAEMVKLIENTYRDVNIAFANELSMISEKYNIDVWEVIKLANLHPRVNILNPGPGVGGHCIAVDPWFLVYDNKDDANLIRQARLTNLKKTQWVISKIKEVVSKFKTQKGRDPVIACMGLSYKPNIDDCRESSALNITKELSQNFNILAVEPNLKKVKDFQLTDINKALEMADILIFLVKHNEFKEIKMKDVEDKIVLDYCGLYAE